MRLIMGTSSPPTYEEAISDPLKQPRRTKEHAKTLVDTYMLSKDSKLDGSVHPGLDTSYQGIKLDTQTHQWVDDLPEDMDL